MPKQLKADLVLLFVTLSWGVSYLLVDLCLTELGPLTLNALRFLLASLGAGIAMFPKMRGMTRETRRYSLGLGTLLGVAYMCSTVGLIYTSMSNAAFLCALAVVLTPIANFIVYRKKPSPRLTFVLLLALAGVALMTLTESLTPRLGDILCVLCAAMYAFDLLLAEHAVKRPRVDAFQMGVMHLGVAGVVNLLLAFVLEKPSLPHSGKVWGAVLFLAAFCTGLAFIAQTMAQQYTTSTHVGVIFALEPVFAGIAAYIFANERLGARGYLGAALLMAGMIVMELPIRVKKEPEQDEHTDLRQE